MTERLGLPGTAMRTEKQGVQSVNHHLMLSVEELFGLSESSWNKELLSSRQEFPGIVILMKRLQ